MYSDREIPSASATPVAWRNSSVSSLIVVSDNNLPMPFCFRKEARARMPGSRRGLIVGKDQQPYSGLPAAMKKKARYSSGSGRGRAKPACAGWGRDHSSCRLVAVAAQHSPINIWAQVFAANSAICRALNGWAAFGRYLPAQRVSICNPLGNGWRFHA
jgi:hypothetical protein